MRKWEYSQPEIEAPAWLLRPASELRLPYKFPNDKGFVHTGFQVRLFFLCWLVWRLACLLGGRKKRHVCFGYLLVGNDQEGCVASPGHMRDVVLCASECETAVARQPL